jgi:hypothetical protein
MKLFEQILQNFPKLWAFYMKWNFCKASYADGTPKPETLFFRVFKWVFYLDCACCAAVRGFLVGFIVGVLLGGLL